MKPQGIEKPFNALSILPSARVDYQQGVKPISHNYNAVVIGCISVSDAANVSRWVSLKRESVFAQQLGIDAGNASVSGCVQNLFCRSVSRTTRVFPPTTPEGRVFRCSHVKAV